MTTLCEVETVPIPELDFQHLSDRQRAVFGWTQSQTPRAYLVTPDIEGTISLVPQRSTGQATTPNVAALLESTVWPRSSWQVPIEPNLFAQDRVGNVVYRPTNTFVDTLDIRRDAVAEVLATLKFEARNEATSQPSPYHRFGALRRQYAQQNWSSLFNILDSFASLAPGWDGYSASPPQQAAIRSAKLFFSQLTESDRDPARVKPSVVGGIGITFKLSDRKCYVEFYNNGTVYALFSDGRADPETYQIRPTAQDYKLLIKAIQDYLNAGHS